MPLLTLEDQLGTSENAPTQFCVAFGFAVPADTADGPVVRVVVNHGRWIARCPLCRGAEMASQHDRRFLCGSCRNTRVGGQWLPVVWPDDADGIETVLMRRPDIHTRNWELAETVDDLVAENVEHRIA